jgi:transposase-like protein
MISMSQFLAVRALLEEDTPKKEIARRLGIDVRTVRNWAKRIQKDGATSTVSVR